MRVNNKTLINKLSTGLVERLLNNLWAICGASVDCHRTSRIVKETARLMRRLAAKRPLFYRKRFLAFSKVSRHKQIDDLRPMEIFLGTAA